MFDMSINRLFQVGIYSLLNLVPYMVLGLNLLKSNFRFSTKKTVLISTILCVIQIILGICAVSLPSSITGFVSLLSTLIYTLFFFFAIKTQPAKIVFVLFFLTNINFLMTISAKYFEGLFFPEYSYIKYHWYFSLLTAILELLILPFVHIFSVKHIRHVIVSKRCEIIWRYLWAIPVVFYITWSHNFYLSSGAGNATKLALRFDTFLLSITTTIGSFLTYYVVFKLLQSYENSLQLEIENYQLSMQSLQYGTLSERIENIRKIKHDLRQHASALTYCLEKEDYTKLKEYLNEYVQTNLQPTPLKVCANYMANSVITYYMQIAQNNDIEFDVQIQIPENIPISDVEFVPLLGNLLENAVESCCRQKSGKRFISLQGGMQSKNTLAFTLDNSFDHKITPVKTGGFLSSKRSVQGTGVVSAISIVERYNGLITFKADNNIFYVSVFVEL